MAPWSPGQLRAARCSVRIPAQIASGTYYITPWADAYDAVLEDTLAININPDDPTEARQQQLQGARDRHHRHAGAGAAGSAGHERHHQRAGLGRCALHGQLDGAERGRGRRRRLTGTTWCWCTIFRTCRRRAADQWVLGAFERPKQLASLASYTNTQSFDLSPATRGLYVTVGGRRGSRADPGGVQREQQRAHRARRGRDASRRSAGGLRPGVGPELLRSELLRREDHRHVDRGQRRGAGLVRHPAVGRLGVDLARPDLHPDAGPPSSARKSMRLATGWPHGASYTASAEVTLPRGIGGNYFVYVVQRPDERTRGVLSRRTELGYERAIRARATAPAYSRSRTATTTWGAATPPSSTASRTSRSPPSPFPRTRSCRAQPLTVEFTVSNEGTRATREDRWVDRLYFSRDPSLDEHDLSSASSCTWARSPPSSSYPQPATFTVPEGASGPFYLIAFADSDLVNISSGAAPTEVAARDAPARRGARVPRRGQQRHRRRHRRHARSPPPTSRCRASSFPRASSWGRRSTSSSR